MLRRPPADTTTLPDCLPCDLHRATLADIRAMATRMCAAAGTNKALIDFCLDVVNRTRGL